MRRLIRDGGPCALATSAFLHVASATGEVATFSQALQLSNWVELPSWHHFVFFAVAGWSLVFFLLGWLARGCWEELCRRFQPSFSVPGTDTPPRRRIEGFFASCRADPNSSGYRP